jgi:hypothetical protein
MARASCESSTHSGTAEAEGSDAQNPIQRPLSKKRDESTVGSSGPSDENGTLRESRPPLVIALLITIRNIHVFSDDRPSKRSRPRTTPTHASWTTSSAASFVAT